MPTYAPQAYEIDFAATSIFAAPGAPQYAMAPGLCEAQNGDLVAAYMRASNHAAANDGNIKAKRSTDGGLTWGAEFTILDTATDLRDVDLVTLANGNILCTYSDDAGGTNYTPSAIISTDHGVTWGSPIAITHDFTGYAYITSRAIELPNGDLLAALYGIDSGDALQSSRVVKSTDGGATWAPLADIVDGPTWGRLAQEPYLAYDAALDRVWCAIRSDTGTDTLYLTYSDDDGATWSTPSAIVAGSGRPALIVTAEGALALAYRDTASSNRTRFRWSWDQGASWTHTALGSATYPYMYASWWVKANGTLAVAWSFETSGTNSRVVYQQFLTPAAEPEPTEPPPAAATTGAAWAYDPSDITADDLTGVIDMSGTAEGDVPTWDAAIGRFVTGAAPGGGAGGGSSGGELLMQDGVSSPPVPLETEDGTDWIYEG